MARLQMSEDNFQESVHLSSEAGSLVCLKSCWVVFLYSLPILLQKCLEHLMCTPPSSYSECTQILSPTEPSCWPLLYFSQICTLVCISMCRLVFVLLVHEQLTRTSELDLLGSLFLQIYYQMFAVLDLEHQQVLRPHIGAAKTSNRNLASYKCYQGDQTEMWQQDHLIQTD